MFSFNPYTFHRSSAFALLHPALAISRMNASLAGFSRGNLPILSRRSPLCPVRLELNSGWVANHHRRCFSVSIKIASFLTAKAKPRIKTDLRLGESQQEALPPTCRKLKGVGHCPDSGQSPKSPVGRGVARQEPGNEKKKRIRTPGHTAHHIAVPAVFKRFFVKGFLR